MELAEDRCEVNPSGRIEIDPPEVTAPVSIPLDGIHVSAFETALGPQDERFGQVGIIDISERYLAGKLDFQEVVQRVAARCGEQRQYQQPYSAAEPIPPTDRFPLKP